jgi:hypothetical protein
VRKGRSFGSVPFRVLPHHHGWTAVAPNTALGTHASAHVCLAEPVSLHRRGRRRVSPVRHRSIGCGRWGRTVDISKNLGTAKKFLRKR